MLKLFKKSVWIDFEDITVCPSIPETHAAIAKYCEDSGYAYTFTGDDEVIIAGIPHEIIRKRSVFYRGRYIIKCREK